jgi:hypothetical protein
MPLRVTAFAPSHYPRILEAAGVETPWIPDRLEHGRAYAAHPSFTIWAGDELACTLGLIPAWPGARRAYCWAFWGPAGFAHPGGVHRLTVRYLRTLIRTYRLLRLDAEVMADFEPGKRWLEHLTFVPLGAPLEYYGPQGETMQRYVWLHPLRKTLAVLWQDGAQEAIPEPVRRPDGSLMPAICGGYEAIGLVGIMMIVGAVATTAGAAVSAYASYQQGQAQKKAYEYNAKVAENQAEIAKQQGEFRARQQRERDRRLRAQARAIQGVSGVEVGEGSSLLVDIDNARQAELNAQAAKYATEAQRANILAEAQLSRFKGDVAERGATLGAGATLLSGLGSAAGSAGRYYGAPPPPPSQPTGVMVPEFRYGYD